MPLSFEPELRQEGSILLRWNQHWLMVMGRLRPGVARGAVEAKLTGELQHWLHEQPIFDRQRDSLPRQHIEVIPAGGGVSALRTLYAQRLKLLMALSALVLMIACFSVANMLMTRSASQRVQIAVQMALGASRRRILQQTIMHGLLLALLGGAAALAVSVFTTRGILLLAFRGTDVAPISPWPSFPVLAFTCAVSLVTGLICSVAPAQLAMHTQPAQPLRGGVRSTHDGSELPHRLLVALQAALSLVLLVATGLLLRSMQNLERQDFGFETKGRLIVKILRPLDQYKPEQLEGFYQNVAQRLRAIPGVLSASFSNYGPMEGNSAGEPVTIPGVTHAPQPEGGLWPDVDHISAGYFMTLGTKILRGRAIDERDTPFSQHVAVVNQAFANLYFPNADPIGKHFGILEAAHSHDYEIVGVAEDAKYGNPHAPSYPTFFLPLLQTETYQDSAENSEQLAQNYVGNIQLRVNGAPQQYEQAVRAALAEINSSLTILYVHSLADEVSANFTQDILLTSLTMLYGFLSLLLASVGLYGVASYAVARRTNEIGIRMALGADRRDVVSMVLRNALKLTAIGLLIGCPVAVVCGYLLRSQLFGVNARDPVILALAICVLGAAAFLAAYLPARRAARIDPMRALRME
jgi:predicted permease